MVCLVEFERPRIQRVGDFFLWVDYIELQCLFAKDNEITLSILDEYLNPNKGLNIDALMWDAEDDRIEESPDDVLSLKYSDIAKTLRTRAAICGRYYPFRYEKSIQTLFRNENLSFEHYLYLFFLFAGNLRFFPSEQRHIFTQDFERLGTDALIKLFPSPWQWRHLGTAKHPTIPSYSGRKIEKLLSLSTDINARFIAPREDFAKSDTSDAGFDFLCWYPFENDNAPHLPLVFAQSGCSADVNEIYNKQRSVSQSRINNFFSQVCSYNVMVTPECFRNASGTWHNTSEITSVFIDRPRLLKLLDASVYSTQNIPSMKFIHSVLHEE